MNLPYTAEEPKPESDAVEAEPAAEVAALEAADLLATDGSTPSVTTATPEGILISSDVTGFIHLTLLNPSLGLAIP